MNKKKAGKILLTALGVAAGTAAVIFTTGVVANIVVSKKQIEYASNIGAVQIEDKLIPEKDSDGCYVFTTDRDFKILQFTDVHIGGGWRSADTDKMAMNAVASMVKAEKPDLVIVTGDISFPTPFHAGTINNMHSAKMFAALMESLGVYWTVTYGNHDTESYSIYDREALSEFYGSQELKYCLFQRGDENIDGYGNNVIKIKNSDGEITQALFTIDSNAYVGKYGGGYDNVHENQIEWYKNTYLKLNEENSEYGEVNSLLFMHIPPVEYAEAWEEYKANGYKDTENVKYHYGFWGENCCPPKYDDQLFETMLTIPGKKGIFCGHDHVNTYSVDYKGIRLTYGYSIDYLAYNGIDKMGLQRGCTVITVKSDGTFDCIGENYYQDKYINDSKEAVTMQSYEGYEQ